MPKDRLGVVAISLISEALGIEEVEINFNTSIENLESWDSLRHVSVVAALEKSIGRQLDIDEVLDVTNVEGIANILKNSGEMT